jgi:hypothetical protein
MISMLDNIECARNRHRATRKHLAIQIVSGPAGWYCPIETSVYRDATVRLLDGNCDNYVVMRLKDTGCGVKEEAEAGQQGFEITGRP